jgi:hypothetical protein
MKQVLNGKIITKSIPYFCFLVLSLMSALIVQAQEGTKKVDVSIDTDGGGSSVFASPWVWVVGGAVFILLLVALLRGGSRKEA